MGDAGDGLADKNRGSRVGHAALFFLIPVVMSALRLYILAQLCADFAGLRGFVQICLSLLPGWRDSIAPALFGLPFAARRLRGALLALAAAVRVVRHAEGRRLSKTLGTAFGILRLFIPIPAALAGEVTAQSKSGRIIPAFGVHRHGDQPSATVLSAPQRTERFLRRLGDALPLKQARRVSSVREIEPESLSMRVLTDFAIIQPSLP